VRKEAAREYRVGSRRRIGKDKMTNRVTKGGRGEEGGSRISDIFKRNNRTIKSPTGEKE